MDARTELSSVADKIIGRHRRRRFSMKLQQKIERALESYVRRFHTDWVPMADENQRKKISAEVKRIIAAARAGNGDKDLVELVNVSDESRQPADGIRSSMEKEMTELAEKLPVSEWVRSINGAGMLGLATIVAEAGPLNLYANPQKLWKRLGFAPYDGFAGSSWKRDSWRPRALSKEEWIANPFNGERYALIIMLAEALFRKQWIGKNKTEDGVGKPNGPYGEIYAARRAHTKEAHPDWTDGHAQKDALRIMIKAYLRDLWCVWNSKPIKTKSADHKGDDAQSANVGRAAGHASLDAQGTHARRTSSKKSADQGVCDAQKAAVGRAADQIAADAQRTRARRASSKKSADQERGDAHKEHVGRAAGQSRSDAQVGRARRTSSKKSADQTACDAHVLNVGRAAGQASLDAQIPSARRTSSRR